LLTPPIIDGLSGDWPFGNTIDLSRATAYSFSGVIDSPADLSAVIRSGWDEQWLYLLIEVSDDRIVADSIDVWRDDGVEIGLDGLHDQTAWGWDDHQYTLVVDGRMTDRSVATQKLAAAVLQYQGGYNIEVGIPIAQLIPGSPISGTVVGLTIGLHDDDDGGNWDGYLIWQGTNTSSVPEEFGSLTFVERAEDRLIALEARIAKLEAEIGELLVALSNFAPLSQSTLGAPVAAAGTVPTTMPDPGEMPTATAVAATGTVTIAAGSTIVPSPVEEYTRTPEAMPAITPTPIRSTETILTLQQGVGGYAGCEDTYIDQGSPTASFCTEERIKVGAGQASAGILRFDLTSIPRNAVVTAAILQVFASEWGGSDSLLGVSPILRSTSSCEATWDQAGSGNLWAEAGCNNTTTDRRGTAESTVRTNGVRRWYEFTVAEVVQGWVDGSLSNNGLLLRTTETNLGEGFAFSSAQAGDPSLRPRLVITYNVPEAVRTPATTP
jgi:hypothetical protein